jgi:hypothetical protein
LIWGWNMSSAGVILKMAQRRQALIVWAMALPIAYWPLALCGSEIAGQGHRKKPTMVV